MQYLPIVAGIFLAFYTLKQSQEEIMAAKTDQKEYSGKTLDELFQKHGKQKGIDPKLLKAVAKRESSLNPQAYNPNDPSYGLMQLLCRQNDKTGTCSNKLNVQDWPPENPNQLFDPDYSLHIAAQILRWNIDNYGFKRGIAVYNAWSAHTAPPDGPFPNQEYVNDVLAYYRELGGDVPRK